MKQKINVPEVGESITEGILVEWLRQDGEFVELDDALFELETDKITMTVTSEFSGTLSIQTEAGATVEIGEVVAIVDTDVEAPADAEPTEMKDEPEKAEPLVTAESGAAGDEGPPISAPAGKEQARQKLIETKLKELSPAVRRLVVEHELDPGKIPGSGKGGRVTKEDALKAMGGGQAEEAAVAKRESKTEAEPAPKPAVKPVVTGERGERQTRKTMSPLRQRIAERLVEAQQTAAMLTTFNEADLSALMDMRARHKEAFEKKHGIKLGIMSFFIKASIEALKTVPEVGAQIEGDEIVYNHFYDIGIAVSTDRGLVVPVIRDPDKKSFAEIELEIADYAKRARERKLTLDELQGGVFTISNGGIFGSLLSTPILNPPQSAILGMHAIKKRPMVIGDDNRIEVRPMMYLALTYDHRVVDGRESVTFLKRVVECIEAPERMMFEV